MGKNKEERKNALRWGQPGPQGRMILSFLEWLGLSRFPEKGALATYTFLGLLALGTTTKADAILQEVNPVKCYRICTSRYCT